MGRQVGHKNPVEERGCNQWKLAEGAILPEGTQWESGTMSLLTEDVRTGGVFSMPSHQQKGTWHAGCGNTGGKAASGTLA